MRNVQLTPDESLEERELPLRQLGPPPPVQIDQHGPAALYQDGSLAGTAAPCPLYDVGQSVDVRWQHPAIPLDVVLQHLQQASRHRAVGLNGILGKPIFRRGRGCLKNLVLTKSSPNSVTLMTYINH